MSHYPKPALTGDAVILAGEGPDTRVLVIQRKKPPFQGEYAFPGGFAEPYELPLHTVLRELKEETGLQLAPTRAVPLSLRTREGRDPRGWTLSQPYLFYLERPLPVHAADDAAQAEWRLLKEMDQLAFDHGAILCEALGKFWEGMPSFHLLLKGIQPYSTKKLPSGPVPFFGGTFNPWHDGHTACVSLCPHSVVVVPDMNPFKAGQNKSCYWQEFRHILTRVQDQVHGVFSGFFGLEMVNPTVGWLPFTSCDQKALLIGDDNLAGLPSWIEAARLVKALDLLYVAPRLADPKKLEAASIWLHDQNPHCKLIFLQDHPHRNISSTAIRDARPLNP